MTSFSLTLVAAALLLAVLGVVRAQAPQDYIDDNPGTGWTVAMFYTTTPPGGSPVVVSGPDGCFANDGDIASSAQALADTRTRVCADRLSMFNQPSPTSFCMRSNDTTLNGSMWKVTCTGAGDTTDNVLSQCQVGYAAVSPCYPVNTTNAYGAYLSGYQSRCSMSAKPFVLYSAKWGRNVASFANYDKLPCNYFASVPQNEKRFYCVGKNGDHLLMCPDNVLRKCTGGCITKTEQLRGWSRQCGKAGCNFPSSAS